MHIYDKDFTQTELPMTKQEIRAISIAKLMLKPNSILIDVGAGTGTIGIEAATYMPQGKVYAIEKEEKGLDTIKLNAERFELKNFELIHGKAPDVIPNIAYDRMFIGGSTGGLDEIINHFMKYATDGGILVINCITLETQSKAIEILKEKGFKDIEIITVTVGRAKKVGPYTMMFGENPICIIKVIKRNSN
ncbi:MAG: precorrin-6Y C5,15-methyltransferase (decarboxylating) subunit CbiT [Fusobacterium gastrosuis]|uniref:precorrin-6Y C5,15-methyltransferase (decarboxylating) subunit CbiT n=1 Tax=Fusobacterium TaxID=848 RepID=UPI0025BDDCB4|nr:precorrin-6Y C5,15-methyltransferase (decarboxylating) subunit CbiT [Fusobacterium sp.]MCI5724500.1 precorrin-6Y C5,15-methyltransferase (decarboxylating) subunit CbiT [Fusobacterium sp.]MDY4010301.1 precorrin-6Y C5,15-methyltransferase (decarboxylating) subunit CbiT [Fusobacterium gastrosuis]